MENEDNISKPPSTELTDKDYDRIYNSIIGILNNLNFIPKINPKTVPDVEKNQKEYSLHYDEVNLLNESPALQEKTKLRDLINQNFNPKYTYIRPFFKYDLNGVTYGNIPLKEYDFIFIVIHSILEHYTFKKPELLQSMYTILFNKTGSLFPFLYVDLSTVDKEIICQKIITELYNFAFFKGTTKKQFPTSETK